MVKKESKMEEDEGQVYQMSGGQLLLSTDVHSHTTYMHHEFVSVRTGLENGLDKEKDIFERTVCPVAGCAGSTGTV